MGCIYKTNTIKIKPFSDKKETKIITNITQSNKIYKSDKLKTTTCKTLNYSDIKCTIHPYQSIKKSQNISILALNKIDYSKKLSPKSWASVLNFLSFKELFEAGKVNNLFNTISKNESILKKFFQKRKNKYASENNGVIKKVVLVNIVFYPHKE